MHEYAHLARYDDWLQLFQAIARAVGGLHPAVGWLSRRIDLDREAACDDYVVARTGAARQYASALLEAAVVAGAGPAVPADRSRCHLARIGASPPGRTAPRPGARLAARGQRRWRPWAWCSR